MFEVVINEHNVNYFDVSIALSLKKQNVNKCYFDNH